MIWKWFGFDYSPWCWSSSPPSHWSPTPWSACWPSLIRARMSWATPCSPPPPWLLSSTPSWSCRWEGISIFLSRFSSESTASSFLKDLCGRLHDYRYAAGSRCQLAALVELGDENQIRPHVEIQFLNVTVFGVSLSAETKAAFVCYQ